MVSYPKDWETVHLRDLLIPYGGLSGKNSSDFVGGNTKYISYLDVFNNALVTSANSKVVIQPGEKQNVVGNGDILFTQSSETVEEVGMASTYIGKEEVYLNSFCFGSKKRRELNSIFMVSLLRSKELREQISKEGQGSTRYNLSPNRLMNICVTIPPVPEQQAIADALTAFDTHINNLAKLIEKKKMIRDGAVEDLVSGKRRLAGFSGEWEEYPFGKYFKKIGNNTFSRDDLSDRGNIGNIHYGDILTVYGPVLNSDDYIPRLRDDSFFSEMNSLSKNDVIIADTAEDETVGKVVQIGNVNIPIVSGLHTIACRPNYHTAPRFLGYYMNSKRFHDQIMPFITGIKVSSISKKSLDELKLYIPTSLTEQQAIADILTVMDKEISDLEKEKEKYMALKAGAMDDLLTGKIRLV